MTEAADQRFAPPQAHVADVASGEMELAGRWMRLGAAIIDTIIGGAIGMVVMQLPLMQSLLKTQAPPTEMWAWRPVSLLMGVVLFLLVQGWPLATRAQTIGKIVCKLRIVRTDGSRPDALRLLGVRYGIGVLMNLNTGVAMIYGMLDCLLIFRESRKCLHDTIADTVVIKL